MKFQHHLSPSPESFVDVCQTQTSRSRRSRSFNLDKKIALGVEVIKRCERHSQIAQDTVRGAEVEVEIRAGVLDDVRVACEAIGAEGLGLHKYLHIFLAVQGRRVDFGQDGDRGVNAGFELREGGLGVGEVGVFVQGEASGEEFCRIRDGLDLIVKAWYC